MTSQGSKTFWVKCKPYFSNKHSKADTDIILHEKGDIIFKNKEIADTFKEYFVPYQVHKAYPCKPFDEILLLRSQVLAET